MWVLGGRVCVDQGHGKGSAGGLRHCLRCPCGTPPGASHTVPVLVPRWARALASSLPADAGRALSVDGAHALKGGTSLRRATRCLIDTPGSTSARPRAASWTRCGRSWACWPSRRTHTSPHTRYPCPARPSLLLSPSRVQSGSCAVQPPRVLSVLEAGGWGWVWALLIRKGPRALSPSPRPTSSRPASPPGSEDLPVPWDPSDFLPWPEPALLSGLEAAVPRASSAASPIPGGATPRCQPASGGPHPSAGHWKLPQLNSQLVLGPGAPGW